MQKLQYYNEDSVDTSTKVRLNYYNFDQGARGEEFQYVFDITPCFPPEAIFDFRIAFPVDVASVETSGNVKDLVDQVREEIEVAAKVTPIRVQNVMVRDWCIKPKICYDPFNLFVRSISPMTTCTQWPPWWTFLLAYLDSTCEF